MTNPNNWSFDYELSDKEANDFYEADNGRDVVAHIANQLIPGKALGNPFVGHATFLLPDTTVYQVKFDDGEHGGLGYVTYMGGHYNAEDMAAIVARQVIKTKSEVAIALGLHLKKSKFGEDTALANNLLEHFWFRHPGLTDYQLGWMDNSLRIQSEPYRNLIAFLENPNDPKFATLLADVEVAGDFSSIYLEETA